MKQVFLFPPPLSIHSSQDRIDRCYTSNVVTLLKKKKKNNHMPEHKHQPNTHQQANWALALGSISPCAFFTTTQPQSKPNRNQNTTRGLWMGHRTLWT